MGTILPFEQLKKRTYNHLHRPFCRNRVTYLVDLPAKDEPVTAADCMQCIHRIARGDNQNSFSILDVCREFPLAKETDPDDGEVKPVRYSFSGSRRFLMPMEDPYGYCGDKIRSGKCRDFKCIRKKARQ